LIYAAAGIPAHWIVNLHDRCLEVYRASDPQTGSSSERLLARPGERINIAAFPDVRINVAKAGRSTPSSPMLLQCVHVDLGALSHDCILVVQEWEYEGVIFHSGASRQPAQRQPANVGIVRRKQFLDPPAREGNLQAVDFAQGGLDDTGVSVRKHADDRVLGLRRRWRPSARRPMISRLSTKSIGRTSSTLSGVSRNASASAASAFSCRLGLDSGAAYRASSARSASSDPSTSVTARSPSNTAVPLPSRDPVASTSRHANRVPIILNHHADKAGGIPIALA
jgi:hypothetical protein